MTETESPPRAVGRFEFNLLRITAALLEHAPVNPPILALVANEFKCPPCLSPTAIELLEEALAKGVVQFFAARGWQSETFLRNEEAVKGSLWQRTPADQLGLEFSRTTVRFLMDMTASRLQRLKTWKSGRPRTIGDDVVIFFAIRALAENEKGDELWDSASSIATSPLAALMFPDRFADASKASPDFLPWMDGPGACVLEVMQADLANRWAAMDRRKSNIQDPATMARIGSHQAAVLEAFLDAVESQQRWDLCPFLLMAINRVVTAESNAAQWIGKLNMGKTRLAMRAETYEYAVTLLRAAQRLAKWHAKTLGIGYFDEGYKAAQLWKAHWEQFEADAKMERIESVLKELQF